MRWTRGACRLAQALGAALLVLQSAGAAAQWTAVARGDEIHAPFADQTTVRRNGAMATMSGMYDFRKQDFTPAGKGLYSTVVLREYDCDGGRVRLLSAIAARDNTTKSPFGKTS